MTTTTRRKRELANNYPLTTGGVTVDAVEKRVAAKCPYCGAGVGEPCRTASGKEPREGSHRARWRELSSQMRSGEFYVEMFTDDPRFGLVKGDVLLAQAYRYDPEKVTVLRRLADGFDPQGNQYWHDILFLSFAD